MTSLFRLRKLFCDDVKWPLSCCCFNNTNGCLKQEIFVSCLNFDVVVCHASTPSPPPCVDLLYKSITCPQWFITRCQPLLHAHLLQMTSLSPALSSKPVLVPWRSGGGCGGLDGAQPGDTQQTVELGPFGSRGSGSRGAGLGEKEMAGRQSSEDGQSVRVWRGRGGNNNKVTTKSASGAAGSPGWTSHTEIPERDRRKKGRQKGWREGEVSAGEDEGVKTTKWKMQRGFPDPLLLPLAVAGAHREADQDSMGPLPTVHVTHRKTPALISAGFLSLFV